LKNTIIYKPLDQNSLKQITNIIVTYIVREYNNRRNEKTSQKKAKQGHHKQQAVKTVINVACPKKQTHSSKLQ
jgi:Na+-transporting methylmalonyl-CoA/oxaloacetate decarboxylase gamma subunit